MCLAALCITACEAKDTPGVSLDKAESQLEQSEELEQAYRLWLQWVLQEEIIPHLANVDVITPDPTRNPFYDIDCSISLQQLAELGLRWLNDPEVSIGADYNAPFRNFLIEYDHDKGKPKRLEAGKYTVSNYFHDPLYFQGLVMHELHHGWDRGCLPPTDGRVFFQFAREARAYEITALYLLHALPPGQSLSSQASTLLQAYENRAEQHIIPQPTQQPQWYNLIATLQSVDLFADDQVRLGFLQAAPQADWQNTVSHAQIELAAKYLLETGSKATQEFADFLRKIRQKEILLEEEQVRELDAKLARMLAFGAMLTNFLLPAAGKTGRDIDSTTHPYLYAADRAYEFTAMVKFTVNWRLYHSWSHGFDHKEPIQPYRDLESYQPFLQWMRDQGQERLAALLY